MAVETELVGYQKERRKTKKNPSHSVLWSQSSTMLFFPTAFKEGTWKNMNSTKPIGETLMSWLSYGIASFAPKGSQVHWNSSGPQLTLVKLFPRMKFEPLLLGLKERARLSPVSWWIKNNHDRVTTGLSTLLIGSFYIIVLLGKRKDTSEEMEQQTSRSAQVARGLGVGWQRHTQVTRGPLPNVLVDQG